MGKVRDILGVIKPAGWVVLTLGVLAGLTAVATHWRELAVIATACLLLVLVALPFLLGRTKVRVTVRLDPERVVAGQSVSAGVEVTNTASGRLMPTVLDLPVGDSTHRYGIPALAAGNSFDEVFTIRTDRRGVIAVGPAQTRRGDPLSLVSRDVSWTGVTEIFVRPEMAPLDALGAGLLRDLEGVSTDAVSQSDLAFHALREYAPGDDLRHVHWRSSAKAMAANGDTQLLVRQYLDTRRSHLTVVVEDQLSAWPADRDGSLASVQADPFELAMGVAGSLARRAGVDEFEVSFACGDVAGTGSEASRALDAICRSEMKPKASAVGITETARRAAAMSPDTSLLFLIGSASTEYQTFRRAAAAFPPEVRALAIQVDRLASSGAVESAGLPLLRLAELADLGSLLRWSLR